MVSGVPGHPGYSGGVPPNSGHKDWKEHHPQSFEACGRNRPDWPSAVIFAQRSARSRSKYSSSSLEGWRNIESRTLMYINRSWWGIVPWRRQYTRA